MNNAVRPARLETKDAANSRKLIARTSRNSPAWVAAWVVFSSFYSCTGWVLSGLHKLDAAGYAVAFLAGLAMVWLLRARLFPRNFGGWNLRKQRRRFARAFPLAFLVLALLAILGGAIHAPNNYDALAYRIPRVLHWLADGQWHWIHTDFQRVNTRACGMEWLSAPLIAFTKTDRWLFLINAVSFLLLPGLVFSVFTQVGVNRRVAWHWMWLLPTGYCYLLQAGSLANDMFSAVYALAAVDFALRAQRTGRAWDVCLSVLSAALLTGAKATNLPLLLPWAVALLPTWRVWLAHPLALAALIPPALGASVLPTLAMNVLHCGDWTGAAAEHINVGAGPMWLRLLTNATNWTLENVVPPVFPFASAWNRAADALTPASLAALLERHFEPAAAHWRLPEIQVEDVAGLGFGITILLGLSFLAAILVRKQRARLHAVPSGYLVRRLVCVAPWVSLLYAMMKLNLSSGPRFLAPYYPLLSLGLLLSPAQAGLVKRNWWRSWAWLSCGLAGLLLIISPARPLWPATWFCQQYGSRLRSSRLGSLAIAAYATKSNRGEVFAPVITMLPADASVLGFSADDFPETSLWKPFGSRRILHLKTSDSPEEIRQRGIKYALVVDDKLTESWGQWLQRMDARELQTVSLKMWGSRPPFVWHLVEFKAHGASQDNPSPAPNHQNEQ